MCTQFTFRQTSNVNDLTHLFISNFRINQTIESFVVIINTFENILFIYSSMNFQNYVLGEKIDQKLRASKIYCQ